MITEPTIQRIHRALSAAVVALQVYPLVDLDDPHGVLRDVYASVAREFGLLEVEHREIERLVNRAIAGARFVERRVRLAPGESPRPETLTLLEIAQRTRTIHGLVKP